MKQLRQFENKSGVVFDANKKKYLFAEDLKDIDDNFQEIQNGNCDIVGLAIGGVPLANDEIFKVSYDIESGLPVFLDTSVNAFSITNNGVNGDGEFGLFHAVSGSDLSIVDISAIDLNNDFSISFDVFLNEAVGYTGLLSSYIAGYTGWAVVFYPQNKVGFAFNIGGITYDFVANTALELETLYHIQITRSGSVFNLYINSELDNSVDMSTIFDPFVMANGDENAFSIGRFYIDQDAYHGNYKLKNLLIVVGSTAELNMTFAQIGESQKATALVVKKDGSVSIPNLN